MINKEKGIIIEEANMSNDDPYSLIFYNNLKAVLQKSKYRNLITGEVEDIKKIELDDIKNVYDSFYHPKNMFLIITGNFNPYEMAKITEENLSKKEFKEYIEPVIIDETEPKKVTVEYSETNVNVSYPKIKYSLKIPLNKFKNIENLDLKILVRLILNINFGPTSDFYTELIEKELVTSLSSTLDIYEDYLVITISATTNYKDEVIKRLKEKIDMLEISEKDIIRKKNATLATLILDYDDIETVSMKIQDDIINEGKIITDLKERISNIDKDILNNVLKNITNDNVSVNVFMPNKNQDN